MPGGSRRPVVQQWPGDADSLAALWREFREFRGGLLGTEDFPLGELPQIKQAIAAAERHRAEDVQRLHSRLDAMPAEIVRQINGSYVQVLGLPDAIGAVLDARAKARWKFLAGEGGKVLIGAFVLVLAAVLATLLHLVNPALP